MIQNEEIMRVIFHLFDAINIIILQLKLEKRKITSTYFSLSFFESLQLEIGSFPI
jgi:hypothetical protein